MFMLDHYVLDVLVALSAEIIRETPRSAISKPNSEFRQSLVNEFLWVSAHQQNQTWAPAHLCVTEMQCGNAGEICNTERMPCPKMEDITSQRGI